MPSVAESAANLKNNQLAASLTTGLETLDLNQVIKFVRYIRVVLPLDGFVFWVRADLLSASALYNASGFNKVQLNQAPAATTKPNTIEVPGSFHFAAVLTQNEDETVTNNQVIFTAEQEVVDLSSVQPHELYLGQSPNGELRFAFARQENFYIQADLYHYRGDTINAAVASQFIDSLDQLQAHELVISNSLPLWLSLNQATHPWPMFLPGFPVPLYPSFAAPNNLIPPYGVVHIAPEGTVGMQLAPYLDGDSNQWQLVKDRVKVTFFGVRNRQVLDFINYVSQYTLLTELMGVSSIPVPRDEKREEVEFQILAMKKSIEFEVNYNQGTVRNVARQLIESAFADAVVVDDPYITGFYNDGGVLCVLPSFGYPVSPTGLAPGTFWSNGSAVAIVPGFTPDLGPLVYYPAVTPAQLQARGGAVLPTARGLPGSGSLWNNGHEVAIS